MLTNDVPHWTNEEPLDKEKYLFAYCVYLKAWHVLSFILFKMK